MRDCVPGVRRRWTDLLAPTLVEVRLWLRAGDATFSSLSAGLTALHDCPSLEVIDLQAMSLTLDAYKHVRGAHKNRWPKLRSLKLVPVS